MVSWGGWSLSQPTNFCNQHPGRAAARVGAPQWGWMEVELGLVLPPSHHPAGWPAVSHPQFRVLMPGEKSMGLQLSNLLVAAGNCGLDP